MTTACPACGTQLVRIEYGYPPAGAVEAAERHEIVLGGCSVEAESPEWACAHREQERLAALPDPPY